MKHVHWGALAGLILSLVAIGVAAYFFTRYVRGPDRENLLRQGFFCDWVYSCAILVALGVLGLEAFADEASAQESFTAGLIALFGGIGGICLWKSLRHQAVVTEAGVEISYVLRPKLRLGWTEIAHIRKGFLNITIGSTRYYKGVFLPEYWDNLPYLIERAETRRIRMTGFKD